MVILTLKICAREIAQQNDNNLEGDDTFLVGGQNVKSDHLLNPKPYELLNP